MEKGSILTAPNQSSSAELPTPEANTKVAPSGITLIPQPSSDPHDPLVLTT